MHVRRWLSVFLVCCAVGCALRPSHCSADASTDLVIERAKTHFRTGDALYRAGQYAESIVEFEAGYALAPRAEFLLNLGQAHRQLRHFGIAITMFEKYLVSSSKTDPSRPEVEAVLVELRAAAAAAEPPAPAPVAEVVAPPPAPPPARRAWYRDPLGGALFGAGLGVAAAGAGLVGYAVPTIADAELDLDHYARARDANPLRISGAVLLGVGGAMILGGTIRWATRRQ